MFMLRNNSRVWFPIDLFSGGGGPALDFKVVATSGSNRNFVADT